MPHPPSTWVTPSALTHTSLGSCSGSQHPVKAPQTLGHGLKTPICKTCLETGHKLRKSAGTYLMSIFQYWLQLQKNNHWRGSDISSLQVLWRRPGDIANLRCQPPDALHIQTSGQYCHESSPRDWEYTGKASLSFSPDVLPSLKSSWTYCKMPRASRFCGQTPLEATFLFIFDDKLFISIPLCPLWPQSQGTMWDGRKGMAS